MLVGRNGELAALDSGLEQLAAGRGAVYLASGEPGIGKTRLANELATRAEARGIRVAWGACWEAGGAPAFWPWQEALASLAIRFPDGGAIATTDPAQARFALFRDVAQALTSAAAAQPIVVVLEDLHGADLSTVHLLEFLATQVRTSPIIVVGTYRDLEARLRGDVGDVLARVGRAGTLMTLARLREPEVAAVVRASVEDADEQLIARVFETTHGNPLFVAEIVQQVRTGSESSTIPLGVREVIRQRLALVPDTSRRALDAGAVLGVEFGAAAVGRMAPDANAGVDAAIAGGFLTQRGDRLRFAHALYREALYHDLARPARQELHREAARALTATGAPTAEIAHHLLESTADAAPEAIEQAIVAAYQAVAVFAFEDAIALLRRAKLAIPDRPPESLLHARVLIALGDVCIRSGDPKGRELCVEGARIARDQGDASLLAMAGLAYGSVFLIGGVDPTMVGMLEDALAQLPETDSGLRARTMARLAAARQPSAPALRPRDLELAFAAVEMGRRGASRRELLEILQSASGALYGAADPRRRIDMSRQQVQLAEELGDVPRLIAGYVRLAMDHLELADMAGYERVASLYERVAARFGSAAGPWRVPLMRSMLALARDDFAQSERWQAVALTIEPDHPRAQRARAYHRICFLRAAERHTELRAALGELRSLWMAMPYGTILADARVASTLMRIGADDEVRAVLAALAPEAFDEEINALALADALWSTANIEQAERLLPTLGLHAHRWTAYWLDVEIIEKPVDASLAYLHAILGEWEECERCFAAAMRDVEQLGRRSIAARMQFELGDLLVRCGRDLERARGLLVSARDGAVSLGLGELVALIDRRHGAVPASAPSPVRRAFSIVREGEYYAVTWAAATLRFKASRGMQYLAQLVDRAGNEVHVLELVGSSEGADRGNGGEVVDARALSAYRARVDALRDALEVAEERGDADAAERARSELDALATELSRGTGLGGSPRRSESAVDRARSAVQRRIKDAVDRIAAQEPELGAWLRRVVRTGNHCSFQGNA